MIEDFVLKSFLNYIATVRLKRVLKTQIKQFLKHTYSKIFVF